MMKIIKDENEIAKLVQEFRNNFLRISDQKINCTIGYPGGSEQDNVDYSSKYDLWFCGQKLHSRWWNGIGIGKPKTKGSNSVGGEINFSFDGKSKRVGGIFATDENKKIYILHRGKVRLGKRGMEFFSANFRGENIWAIEDDSEKEFCFVCELNSDLMPQQVSTFIHEIKRIKNLGKRIKIDSKQFEFNEIKEFSYTKESSGRTISENNKPTIRERTHGIVVNNLAKLLEDKGLKVGNDRNRDLFIYEKGEIKTLFEIKTNSSTQSLSTAIGQLIVYSIPITNVCKLVAVLPEKLNLKVENRLNSLGIKILYYSWEEKPKFDETGLNKILK